MAGRWTKPGRLEKNLGKIAKDINSKRGIDVWLKIQGISL